jgi:hypothetical protein
MMAPSCLQHFINFCPLVRQCLNILFSRFFSAEQYLREQPACFFFSFVDKIRIALFRKHDALQ